MRQEGSLQKPLDVLSPLTREAMELNEATTYTHLVVRGDGSTAARAVLEKLTAQTVLSASAANPDNARCLLAGLWLWHDWLDEAHRLAQQVSSDTGNFWHAIVHRREGDFDNSRYWYERCADHPVTAVLAAQAGAIINDVPADKTLLRLVWNGWHAESLVDLVQQVHARPDDPRLVTAVRLQQMEWRVLFDHCTRAARG